MKTLTIYNIYEELFDSEGMLNEGIGLKKLAQKIGSIFGGSKSDKKTQEEINNLDSDDKKAVLSTQTVAIQSKDKASTEQSKKLSEQIAGLKDKTPSKILGIYIERAEAILRDHDDITHPNFIISLRNYIKTYGLKEKNKAAIEMVDELNELLDKKWPKGVKKEEEQVKKTEETINNAQDQTGDNGSNEGGAETSEEGEGKKKVEKLENEIQQGVKDEIKDEKDLLGPLAKQANIDGQLLLEFVSKKLTFNLLKNSKVMDKDGKEVDYKVAGKVASTAIKNLDTESDSFKNDVLGMCIVICGAIISGNGERFMKICEVLKIDEAKTADELRKQVTNFAKAERGKAISKAKKEAKKAENEKA